MNKDFKTYTIFDTVTPQTVTSSTDASPVVVTKASHGLSTGDKVLINGHTTNVAVNGTWIVTVLNSSTFTLKDINTGVAVNGSGGGAGSGGVMVSSPKIISTKDFTNIEIQIGTGSSASMTVKVAGSLGIATPSSHGDTPNFGATITAANHYSFLQVVDLSDNSSIDGGTGFVVSGTDAQKNFEVNTNAIDYICLIPTAWSAGTITAKVTLYNI